MTKQIDELISCFAENLPGSTMVYLADEVDAALEAALKPGEPIGYRYKYLNFMGDEVWAFEPPRNGRVLETVPVYTAAPPSLIPPPDEQKHPFALWGEYETKIEALQNEVAFHKDLSEKAMQSPPVTFEITRLKSVIEDMLLANADPPRREPLSDEQAKRIAKVSPVYAPDGWVERRPEEYRREIECARLAGIRLAEEAHGIK